MRTFFIFATGTILSLSVASTALAAPCDADVVLIRGSSASSKLIEVHLRDGKVARIGNEFGIGRKE